MQDLERGASPDPDARLKGEMLASYSEWTAEYGLIRLDLAWTVAHTLQKYVARTQEIDVYLEFIERLSAIMQDEAAEIRKVLTDDMRKRAN